MYKRQSLGHPSWAARFSAQITADPVYGDTVHGHPALAVALDEAAAAVWSHAPDLPGRDRDRRTRMVRLLVIHTCAEEEATGAPDWPEIGESLLDAATGLILAPPHRSSSLRNS